MALIAVAVPVRIRVLVPWPWMPALVRPEMPASVRRLDRVVETPSVPCATCRRTVISLLASATLTLMPWMVLTAASSVMRSTVPGMWVTGVGLAASSATARDWLEGVAETPETPDAPDALEAWWLTALALLVALLLDAPTKAWVYGLACGLVLLLPPLMFILVD